MEGEIILRKAKNEDIPRFIEIEKDAESKIYSATTTEKEWQEEFAKENATVYAIAKGKDVVGDISYEIKDKSTAYISGLCIDKNFQGQGVGKEAVKLMLGDLKNFEKIELATHPDNTNAIKLYKSFGFETKSQIENYFGDGQPRIIMVLEK